MAKIIGVTLSERVQAGLVVDNKLAGPLHCFPEKEEDDSAMIEMPTDDLVKMLADQIACAAEGHDDVTAVGVALPGFVRNGVVEDSPNLQQLKGARIQELLSNKLAENGLKVSVNILNDADGMASGLAATQGKLDRLIRVWTLGIGIGFGRYPFIEGAWEGGHSVVTLDEKERFCGCGGRGHIEGIMGHRAMRLRFLDMEPEEVFEAANSPNPDKRCLDFKRLWHKALAAGTASEIHQEGAGKFFLTGFNVRFVDMPMLKDYLQQMIKMSPLQSYSLEIVNDDAETRVIGSAVAAEQAAARG